MTFDVAAQAYDRFMGAWSALLAPQMADLAGLRRGSTALDVGCGPGSLLTELVARLGPEAVTGADPSASFVAAARERHAGVTVVEAVAERLPFPTASFDASFAQLVVHFMSDPVAGLREMARVTRPGGTVAACVWDFAGDRGPLGPFWSAARALDPDVEDESALPGTRAGHLVDLLTSAGLHEARGTALTVARTWPDFDAWWEPFTRGVGPAGAYLAGLPVDSRRRLEERCRRMLPGSSVAITAVAWGAVGVVPPGGAGSA